MLLRSRRKEMRRNRLSTIMLALAIVALTATVASARVEVAGVADATCSVDLGFRVRLCVEGCVLVGRLGVSGSCATASTRDGVPGSASDLLAVRVSASDAAEWGIPVVRAILTIATKGAVR